MKIIHLQGFSEEERLQYREIIHSNVILSMRSIIVALQKSGALDTLQTENQVLPTAQCRYVLSSNRTHRKKLRYLRPIPYSSNKRNPLGV